jgi:hypothetical protein
VPTATWSIESRELFLKSVIKELVAVITEKDKQFRSLDARHDRLFCG